MVTTIITDFMLKFYFNGLLKSMFKDSQINFPLINKSQIVPVLVSQRKKHVARTHLQKGDLQSSVGQEHRTFVRKAIFVSFTIL